MFFDLMLLDWAVLRFLWLIKWTFRTHSYGQPFLRALSLSFTIRALEQLDHPKIFNYVYLFAFFFGRKALFRNYSSLFNLGRYYFSFEVIISFTNKNTIYMALLPLIYELQPFLNLKLTTNYNFSSHEIFSWNLWDLNIFTEKKTNVGLFDLLDSLLAKLLFHNVYYVSRTLCFIKSIKFQV